MNLFRGGCMSFRRFLTGFLASLLIVAAPLPSAPGQGNLNFRRQQLKQLIADEWEYELRETPELATVIGDYRYNDRWSDASLAAIPQHKQEDQKWLSQFQAIDTQGLLEQEKLNHLLMKRKLKDRLEDIEMKTYEMPVDQFNGIHLQLAQFVSLIPFDTTKHYEDYLSRLHKIPHLFADIIEAMKQGENDKLMPPRFLLEKTVEQCKSIAEPAGEANAFGHPVQKFPEGVPVADRQHLRDAILAAVDKEVRPAYTRLSDFIAKEYAPKGRVDPGLWALPDGDKRYRVALRRMTTTDMDPESIHELGLKEVKRIEDEQLDIAKKLGFSDLAAFRVAVKANPKLKASSREQILDRYHLYINQMEPQLPKFFGLLPKTKLEVRPTEEFREKEAASADYSQGTADGSRPGIVHVNTGDYQHRTLISIESTAYHEGIPGHHMQISIAQTLPELPQFRQEASYSAYDEGWALYSERLGKDIGFYQDPYSDYGRLTDEMLRAMRLVLDTGVHYKRWTRQQMVDFFRVHSSVDEPELQAETDRYIAYPGQACAYKLGELDILRLRQLAKAELGRKYDIRAFHDEILNGGSVPLDVLDARVTSWIAEQKGGKTTGTN
jgi:uncharacterized protein (DUF885 family)